MIAGMDVEAKNKAAIQTGFKAWRDGTGSVFDLLTPDARWTIVGNAPVSRTYTIRQEFLDVVINPFNARLSKRLVPTVRGIYADGDMVIALFDAEATARDGKPYRNTYTWYLQLRDGKIVDVIAFFDTIEFTDFWQRVKPQIVEKSHQPHAIKQHVRKVVGDNHPHAQAGLRHPSVE
jgi:ketosteroid isomerase-like protein